MSEKGILFRREMREKISCPSYPGYSVDIEGNVYTHRKRYGKGIGRGGGVVITKKHCRKMNQYIGHGNYLYVSISTAKGQRSIPVHLVILDAFMGPRPEGHETRHLDGNPQNNMLDNLCYGTAKENAQDRILHGRQRNGR